MSNKEEKEFNWNTFLGDHKEAISEIIKGVSTSMVETPKHKFRSTLAIFTLLGIVILLSSVLCYVGKISGEAVTFLMGTIVGYLFTFLQKYVVGMG